MNGQTLENWENRLLAAARELPYPPTPDIAEGVARRLDASRSKTPAYPRVAWALAAVIILLLATVLLVPPVRAAVVDFLQLGAVRIFLVEPEATPTVAPTLTPLNTSSSPQPSPRPTRTPLYLTSLLNLEGEMPLELAIRRLLFPLSLPTHPADLGEPDHTFLQDQEGQFIILVWTDPGNDDEVLLSLHAIGPDSWAIKKMEPEVIDQTEVNGREALWTEGPYPLVMSNDHIDLRRLVAGHVLIWEQDGITYRLESDLSMEEAVKIAESLQPVSR